MRCSRCGKELVDGNFFGMCKFCISTGRKVEHITDDIITMPPYCWVKVDNSNGRWAVMNLETFERLFATDCSLDLILNEEDCEIYIKDTGVKFSKYIAQLYGKKNMKFNNIYDFRFRPFDY